MCVAMNFINDFGSPFKLYSSLKSEGYLVTGSEFKLKLIVDRPEMHGQVTFYAEDSAGEKKLLLNGEPSIYKHVVPGCPQFWDVSVTSPQGHFKFNKMSIRIVTSEISNL